MTKLIKNSIFFFLLIALFCCTASKKEDPAVAQPTEIQQPKTWERFADIYCHSRIEQELDDAGYNKDEKPAIWKKNITREYGINSIANACKIKLLEALHPCVVEYRVDSDSGIRCTQRYNTAFLIEFITALKAMVPHKQDETVEETTNRKLKLLRQHSTSNDNTDDSTTPKPLPESETW